MIRKTVWEKALLLSFLLHLALVPYCSWLIGHNLFTSLPRQKVIELEMVSLPPVQEKKVEKPRAEVKKQVLPKPAVTPEKPVAKEQKVVKTTPVAKNGGEVTDRVAPPTTNSDSEKRGEVNNNNSSSEVTPGPPDNNNPPPPPRKIVYLPPQLLKKVEPPYPSSAREKGMEGTAVVRVEILENGQVGEAQVKRSSGCEELDEAALKAVRKWRFVPAKNKETGEPVKCFTNFPVVFRLT